MDRGPNLQSPEMILQAEVGTMGKVKKGMDMLVDLIVHKGAKVGEISFTAEVRGAKRGFRVIVLETLVDQIAD